MRKQKIIAAVAIVFLGATILFFLGKLLPALVGSLFDLYFCAFGAFLSTLYFYQAGRLKFRENLSGAVGIVFSTFASISLGHAIEQMAVRNIPVDFEPIGKFLWATLIVSWWAIPLTAYALSLLNESTQKK